MQLIRTSCRQNALLRERARSKPSLKLGLSAPVFCLGPFFFFRRCQLPRSLAMVLLRGASTHPQLNLALPSTSRRGVRAAADSQDSAWTEFAAKLTIPPRFIRLSGCHWIHCVCRAQKKFGAPLPTPGLCHERLPAACSVPQPLSLRGSFLPSKKIRYAALEL